MYLGRLLAHEVVVLAEALAEPLLLALHSARPWPSGNKDDIALHALRRAP